MIRQKYTVKRLWYKPKVPLSIFYNRNYFHNYLIQGTLSEGEGPVQFTSPLRQVFVKGEKTILIAKRS
jgi:hypothetical protein